MFQEFSGGYYLGRFFVEPRPGSRVAMGQGEHDSIREWLYGTPSTDTPLVVRFNQQHFAVEGEPGVSEETLALPRDFVDDGDRGQRRNVLLAKATVADELAPFAYLPEDDPGSDPFRPDALRDIDRPT